MIKVLPNYTKTEEELNAITHGLGIPFALIALILCVMRSFHRGSLCFIGSVIYGLSLLAMYLVSTLYHAISPSVTKCRLRTLDHCTIYVLIAGTYTPILLIAIRMVSPAVTWALLLMEWGFGLLAIVLTAIDLKKYSVFSMICYIFMGWSIILFPKIATAALPGRGFIFLLGGGIVYTIGAILYGIGKKHRYVHSIFHVFVLAGSVLQFLCIYFCVL